jgi:hypothetical protein
MNKNIQKKNIIYRTFLLNLTNNLTMCILKLDNQFRRHQFILNISKYHTRKIRLYKLDQRLMSHTLNLIHNPLQMILI